MRTNSLMKVIAKELNKNLSDRGLSVKNIPQREITKVVDQLKNKIQEYVHFQIENNIVIVIRCKCKHFIEEHEDEIKCKFCKCINFTPRHSKTPVSVMFGSDRIIDDFLKE